MTAKTEINYKGVNFTVEYDFTPDEPEAGFRSELSIESMIHKGIEYLETFNSDAIDEIEGIVCKLIHVFDK